MYFSQHDDDEHDVEGEFGFLWDDWMSAIDTQQENWFGTFFEEYLVHIFSEAYEGEGQGACDTEGACFNFNEEGLVCISTYGEDQGCYSTEEALDLYFADDETAVDQEEDREE